MLIPNLLTTLQVRYTLGDIVQVRPLAGGEWKTLFWLDTIRTAFVVSISHPSTIVESIAYEHTFLRYLNPHLPQIPAPLVARDGSTYFQHEGRLVTLFPAMPGEMADRHTMRIPAARFLAQYHQVALTYPDRSARPGQPAWSALDWQANYAWHWPTIQALLASVPAGEQEGDPS